MTGRPMVVPATGLRARLFDLLRSLPLIRFALMLGGGMVATAGVAVVQLWLLGGRFPDSPEIWLARIHGAIWLGLAGIAVIAIVMIALAFGRIDRIAFSNGHVSVDLDFDEADGDKS